MCCEVVDSTEQACAVIIHATLNTCHLGLGMCFQITHHPWVLLKDLNHPASSWNVSVQSSLLWLVLVFTKDKCLHLKSTQYYKIILTSWQRQFPLQAEKSLSDKMSSTYLKVTYKHSMIRANQKTSALKTSVCSSAFDSPDIGMVILIKQPQSEETKVSIWHSLQRCFCCIRTGYWCSAPPISNYSPATSKNRKTGDIFILALSKAYHRFLGPPFLSAYPPGYYE